MLEISKTEYVKDLERLHIKMEMFMKENGKTMRKMVKESIDLKMVIILKEIF